ncbi:integrase core domain-containing protein [Ghiorsea bivora]|uniref:integrase core domain-containing protein n=1 Tax=Ghiorsea bivora TaxID=1485545 RepID=UPI0012FD7231|nr:integrase core domain-containing protein [Ghiorsea bivora]
MKKYQHYYHQPKPKWVKHKVIRLKALMPQAGCRTIAHTFNRLHEHKGMTVSKSYVNTVIRNHQFAIQTLRRKLKHKRPKAVPHNLIWGIDLTGKFDASGKLHHLLGIVEHQSRSCISLKPLIDKSSITLLECIIVAIKRYGKPKMIRTDNEVIFTSKLFRFGLWVLGIKHQQTEIASPWQNGKAERFFGTLKQKLNQWEVPSFEALNHSLHLFGFWYNHVRPHDYLDGATPAEVWTNKKANPYKAQYFEAWDGLLNGYYLPP